ARSEMLGAAARTRSSPLTARRQRPSQSASSAERVEDMTLCLQTRVSAPDGSQGLHPDQIRAVTHERGPLLVLGVPGTGKTRAIQERFQWLVGRGHEPDRMVVVCASDAGAEAMRESLETALQRGYEKLSVHTPAQLAAELLGGADAVSRGDRLAMLLER